MCCRFRFRFRFSVYLCRKTPSRVDSPFVNPTFFFNVFFIYTRIFVFILRSPLFTLDFCFVRFFYVYSCLCVCFFFFACLCFCSRGVGRRCIISALRRRLEFQHLFLLFYFIVFVLFTIAVCYPSCLCRPNVYVRSIQANCSFKIVVIVRYKTDGCQWERDLKSVSYQRLDLAGT